MDSYENEASKFAAQRTKLKNICEAHDLTYTFIKNSYPIKLIIRPIKGVGEQMSMLETASEDSYISPDAYLLFTMKDGVLVYRMSKTFTIEDVLAERTEDFQSGWCFVEVGHIKEFDIGDSTAFNGKLLDGAGVFVKFHCHILQMPV